MSDIRVSLWIAFVQFTFLTSATGAENIERKYGELTCGNAVVKSSTVFYFNDDVDHTGRQVIDQEITVTYDNKTTKLQLDSKRVNKPTFGKVLLDSSVYAWSCLKSSKGRHYILLWYSCTAMDEKGFCSGWKEWLRLFRENGKALDASYRRNHDKRYDKLFKKLGLTEENGELQPLDMGR
jgi:hypothetical protein